MTVTAHGALTGRFSSRASDRRKFSCEEFHPPFSNGANVHWDYRDSEGKLHSGIAFSAEDAKVKAEKQSGEKVE